MSIHVGSRWYRAPEVSLVEKQYDQASDLWSFGCIIFELLQYVQKNKETFYDDFQVKRYLFQGGSCFPLSPCKKKQAESDKKQNVIGTTDQVKVILESIGAQTEEDLSFVSSNHAIQYIRDLENPKQKEIPEFKRQCTEIREKLPEKYQELVDVLQNFLSFNPFFRMTAFEALQSKVFDSVRSIKKE